MLRTLGARARSPLALALTSALVVALATWWIAAPTDAWHGDTSGSTSVLGLLPDPVPAVLLLAAGLTGLVLAFVAARRRPPLLPVGVVAGVLALSCMDTQLISLVGYLCAMAVPFLAVVLLVSTLRRSTTARVTALLALGLVAWWGAASGSLAADVVGHLVSELAGGFARAGARPWFLGGLALVTAQWLATAASVAAPLTARLQRPSARLDRLVTIATLIAVLGPLPYVAVRATWLLPDAVFTGPIRPEDLDPSTRLWGLLLGAAALSGSVLTVGLVRPWGRMFPRWMPFWGGRPVPVAAAAVPGYTVAFVLTASAPSIALMSFAEASDGDPEALWMLLLLPFWLWGPALAVAVWGYVRRRRLEAAPTPRTALAPGRMAA